MMDPQPPAPSSARITAGTSTRPPFAPYKIRIMCSYGGRILPRPHGQSLFYAGGETRIVAVDRRTTAASFSALYDHICRTVYHNRPFHLKYQLPNQDLDPLISVFTDEDLVYMLEEHDRISPNARIRLFLFPVEPDLVDAKSESWFSDALKGTRICKKGQPADLESHGGGGGGEGKNMAESLVLETSSSFGSASSLFSSSNSPPIANPNCDEKGLNFLDTMNRVPSSASMESEHSVGSLAAPSKAGIFEDPLIQLKDHKRQYSLGPVSMAPYYPVYQVPVSQLPPSQPYPVYSVPVIQSQYHNMPVTYNLFYANNTSSSSQPTLHPQPAVITQPIGHHKDVFGTRIAESATKTYSSILAAPQRQLVMVPPDPQIESEAAVITQPIGHKEVFGTQIAESATKVYTSVPASSHLVTVTPDPQLESEPTRIPASPEQVSTEPRIESELTVSSIQCSEFDEDIAYSQIYKTQPMLPLLCSQYQTMKKGTTMLPEPSVHAKQQAGILNGAAV